MSLLIEISEFDGIGFQSLVDFESWRVAILRYHPELEPDDITTMHRHDKTDEVFVLLAGQCILWLGEGNDVVNNIHAIEMLPEKLYNIKQGTWHSHTLSADATVLIVENRNTEASNSPVTTLRADQQTELVQITERLWGKDADHE